MADLVIGLSKTVVEGALTKVQSAIEEDAKLRQKAQRDLVSITLEFEMMQSFLDVAKEESITNNLVRTWVKHVRELAYNLEDCIEFVVHLDNTPDWWQRLLPACVAPPLPLDHAVQELEEIKRRVEDVNNCYRRYKNISDSGSSNSTLLMPASSAAIVDTTALHMIAEARDAAKRQRGLCDLTKLIMTGVTDNHSDLKVIAMWGTGGDLGRTASVIWKAYNEELVSHNFPCRAWVKLMHPFNPHEFIKSLNVEFDANSYRERKGEIVASEVRRRMEATEYDHPERFAQIVNKQRYLIVLEDLSNMAEWGAIRRFIPEMKNGSCIIVSMQQFVVASLCIGRPYQLLELEQFSSNHSVYAFIKKESQCYENEGDDIDDKTEAAQDWMDEHPLIGRESEMSYLKNCVIKADYHKTQEVISVWGIVGVGKSALIKRLFCEIILRDLDIHFDEYGWVDVSHPFDLRDFCRRLLFSFDSGSIHGNKESAAHLDTMRSKNSLLECRKIVRQHKCLIVIDGMKSTKEWDLIKADLLPSSSQNCIIVITNEGSIAKHCHRDKRGHIINVKGVAANAAFRLFKEEVSRKYPKPSSSSDDEVEPSLSSDDEVAEQNESFLEGARLKELISKCGGLPKVIAGIASSVGRVYSASARALSNNFMHDLETNPEFDSLRGLFCWIRNYFSTCPDSLKACIFYLSIFPRDHITRRRRLVRRWIAEGYLRDNYEESAEENGEKHFSNLLDLSIIQQPRQEIATASLGDTRVVRCQVNGFIHEFIVSRQMEENFVFELGDNSALTTQRTGRHLVILSHWDRDKIVFKSIDFSRLRSLTVFGKWESFFVSERMKLLRVLDLEDAHGVRDVDLEKMVSILHRLKFLSLRGCHEICNLPSSFGDLRQLQTLDVRNTSITTLPASISKLQKLQYIRAGSFTRLKTSRELNSAASEPPVSSCWLPKFCKCRRLQEPLLGVMMPGGIGRLTALHTVGVVNIAASSGEVVLKELNELTQLRKLGVSGINGKNSRKLFDAISGQVHLESLSMQLEKDNQNCLDDLSMPWEDLQSLKLYGLQDKLPLSGSHLSKLRKLDLEMDTLKENDMELLGELPKLCILRLQVLKQQLHDSELHFSANLCGNETFSFEKVKILEISCRSSSLHVSFGIWSMGSLEVLKLDCSSGSCYQLSGLENNLYELKQVLLKGTNDETVKAHIENQVAIHPRRPAVRLEEL